MILAYIIESSSLMAFLITNLILSLLALTYQIVKNDTKISFSNLLWALALFGLPVIGVLFYGVVQIAYFGSKNHQETVED